MWQQIAIGIFVGMFAWRVFAFLGSSVVTVLMQRSSRVAWLVARDKVREEDFKRRVEAAVTSPTSGAHYRY